MDHSGLRVQLLTGPKGRSAVSPEAGVQGFDSMAEIQETVLKVQLTGLSIFTVGVSRVQALGS